MIERDRTILIIEDDELKRSTLRTAFQMSPIGLLEAKDMDDGIRILQSHKPDLILIDLELAGMDIRAAVHLIKKDAGFPKIPILAFSAEDKPLDSRKIFNSGITGFISKPILSRPFMEGIESFLFRRKTEEAPPSKPKDKIMSPSADVCLREPIVFDRITGLFSEGYIKQTLDLEIKRAVRHDYSVSFIKLGVDDFHQLRDEYGDWMKDLILRETSEIVRAGIREIDVAGLSDDDTFAVVLPYADKEGAMHVALRILSTAQAHLFSPAISILIDRLSLGIGIVTCPSDTMIAEDVLRMAARRLQKAKEKGKNQFCAQD